MAQDTPIHQVEMFHLAFHRVLEPVPADFAGSHSVPPPSANHYTAAAAIRQKISALAGRTITQTRDVWDLERLSRTTSATPRPLPERVAAQLPQAIERAMAMTFEDYRSQVVPFIAADAKELFETAEAWERIRGLVVDRLLELQS